MAVAFRLDLKPGDSVDGGYTIVKSIGSGSYGDVFLVEGKNGCCAMKILRLFGEPSDLHDDLVRRFRQEYETAQMPGEYLVHSLEYSEMKGNPFFTMEYCPKGDLAKYVGQDTTLLPRLSHNVLLGLYDLHSSGKIHRDLKPENVLVRANGKAALTDFGVVGNKDVSRRLSSVGLFKRPKQKFGSPLYMAPEMNDLKGGGVTYLPTIDIWSFGVMVYELVTNGNFPFGAPKDLSDLPSYQMNGKKGLWNRQKLLDAPNGREWLPIIERCIMPGYQDRYQSVLDIISDVEALMGSAVTSPLTSRPSRSAAISRLVITQGEDVGAVHRLKEKLDGKRRMLRIGRNAQNDIVLKDTSETYVSRFHFTLELSSEGRYWIVRDGQWQIEARQWVPSTNGTFLNASPVSSEGQRLFTGDIITAGEYKFKVE